MISLIQHFEADFFKIQNSGIILKTFTHADVQTDDIFRIKIVAGLGLMSVNWHKPIYNVCLSLQMVILPTA